MNPDPFELMHCVRQNVEVMDSERPIAAHIKEQCLRDRGLVTAVHNDGTREILWRSGFLSSAMNTRYLLPATLDWR